MRVRLKHKGVMIEVEADPGANLKVACERFGIETVFAGWKEHYSRKLKAILAEAMDKQATQSELQDIAEKYAPAGEDARRKKVVRRIVKLLAELSPEQRTALVNEALRQLR